MNLGADPDPPTGLTTGQLDIADAMWVILVTPAEGGKADCWMLNNIPLETVRLHLLDIIDGIDNALRNPDER